MSRTDVKDRVRCPTMSEAEGIIDDEESSDIDEDHEILTGIETLDLAPASEAGSKPPKLTRKNTLEIEGSLFKENESKWAVAWVVYTIAYWTLLTWLPIVVRRAFDANTGGLLVWCAGAIAMIGTAYTIYIGQYPSGANHDDACAIDGIGRYTAGAMTTIIIIDCCVLAYASMDLEQIDTTDTFIYNTQLSRLICHIIHIFWSCLFFYNRFYYNHRSMAIRAFILEWGDIIWTCVVSFTITEPLVVDRIYFVIVGVALIGWVMPMMFNPRWGTRRNAQSVAVHLLLLDLFTDAPVIVALLATHAYKNNPILWIDLFWKSCLVGRSVSEIVVKYYLRNIPLPDTDDGDEETEPSTKCGVTLKVITFVWLIAVGLYWNARVLVGCVLNHEITSNYEYYTWFCGMIGLFFILDMCMEGHSAESNLGKPFMAFTCLVMAVDCILHASELGAGLDDTDDFVDEITVICHCVALASSILFYGHSFTKGIQYSFVLQWVDIVLMFIVYWILTDDLNCFSKPLCIGYFGVFSIKIIFWFVPMLLGCAKREKYIHLHMVLLGTFTDLPLVLTIICTDGYDVHGIVFVDIVFKVMMLLLSYAYHLMIGLLLSNYRRTPTETSKEEDEKELKKDEEDEEIATCADEEEDGSSTIADEDDVEKSPLKSPIKD